MWVVISFLRIFLSFYCDFIWFIIWNHTSILSMIISSFNTVFSYHLIFPFFKNLFTPFVVLNLFLYLLGKTILKNSSSQLLVFGMLLFSMWDSVFSKSLPNLDMGFAISSGKCFIWFFSILYLCFAFLNVFCLIYKCPYNLFKSF